MKRHDDPLETRKEMLEAALLESKHENGDPITHRRERATAMSSTKDDGAVALMRMVDMRIPLPFLLGGFLVCVTLIVGMYYQLQSVARELGELKVTVTASNSQGMAIAGQVALLQFRSEQHEKDLQRLLADKDRSK